MKRDTELIIHVRVPILSAVQLIFLKDGIAALSARSHVKRSAGMRISLSAIPPALTTSTILAASAMNAEINLHVILLI